MKVDGFFGIGHVDLFIWISSSSSFMNFDLSISIGRGDWFNIGKVVGEAECEERMVCRSRVSFLVQIVVYFCLIMLMLFGLSFFGEK